MLEARTTPLDTSEEVMDLLYEKIRKMTQVERAERFFSLCSFARSFTVAGIKKRYPDCSDEELRKRLAAVLHGREFAIKHFGWDPELEGY